jgi:hypothetical protein
MTPYITAMCSYDSWLFHIELLSRHPREFCRNVHQISALMCARILLEPCTQGCPDFLLKSSCTVHVHSMQAHSGLTWVVSFTPRPLYTAGKSPHYPFNKRRGGPQNRYVHWRNDKSFAPAGNESTILQSPGSLQGHHTDYDILGSITCIVHIILQFVPWTAAV